MKGAPTIAYRLTYFLQIIRGIVMKGLGVEYLMDLIIPMVIYPWSSCWP